jgi:hypothetical protein
MTNGRVYSASVTEVAVSAIQDFFELAAGAGSAIELLSVRLGQSTEEGDAAAEMLPVSIHRVTVSGSAGSTPTIRPHQVGDTADATVEANNTTQATGNTELIHDAFNVQIGWLYQPAPDERIIIPPSGLLVVELPVAPADSMNMSGTITWKEIG